jgi:hypothetical protein
MHKITFRYAIYQEQLQRIALKHGRGGFICNQFKLQSNKIEKISLRKTQFMAYMPNAYIQRGCNARSFVFVDRRDAAVASIFTPFTGKTFSRQNPKTVISRQFMAILYFFTCEKIIHQVMFSL